MLPSALLIAILSAFLCGLSFGAERPHIVFILADDMGWRDPACFGGKAVPTPHIDALAASGLSMTRYYSSSAVCTPTRAAILSGRYPLRFDIRSHFPDDESHLPTLCAAADVPVPTQARTDGVDLLPHWQNGAAITRSGPLLWQLDLYSRLQRHYPKPKPYATEAAMDGKWKLLCRDAQPLELFDLEADLAETTNLLETHPEVAARLARDVRAFLDAPRDASGIAPKRPAKK